MAAKAKNNNFTANLGFEAKLWLTADNLRYNLDTVGHKKFTAIRNQIRHE